MAPPSSRLAVLLALTALFSLAAAQVPPPLTPPPPSPPAVLRAPPPPAVPPAPSTGNGTSCDPLKLRVCASVLNGLLGVALPGGDGSQCCPLLRGLVDLDAAACLCTAIKANVLGIINLNVPLGLSLLLNHCDKAVPDGFTCTRA